MGVLPVNSADIDVEEPGDNSLLRGNLSSVKGHEGAIDHDISPVVVLVDRDNGEAVLNGTVVALSSPNRWPEACLANRSGGRLGPEEFMLFRWWGNVAEVLVEEWRG